MHERVDLFLEIPCIYLIPALLIAGQRRTASTLAKSVCL